MGRLGTLATVNLLFVASMLFHAWDHQRQERDLATEVYVGGTMLFVLAALSLYTALRRHPRAAQIATFVGFYTFVGVIAAHIAPHWSAFSDPYPDADVDTLSWIAALSEVGMAFVLGLTGLRALRRDPAAPATASA